MTKTTFLTVFGMSIALVGGAFAQVQVKTGTTAPVSVNASTLVALKQAIGTNNFNAVFRGLVIPKSGNVMVPAQQLSTLQATIARQSAANIAKINTKLGAVGGANIAEVKSLMGISAAAPATRSVVQSAGSAETKFTIASEQSGNAPARAQKETGAPTQSRIAQAANTAIAFEAKGADGNLTKALEDCARDGKTACAAVTESDCTQFDTSTAQGKQQLDNYIKTVLEAGKSNVNSVCGFIKGLMANTANRTAAQAIQAYNKMKNQCPTLVDGLSGNPAACAL